MSSTAFRRPGQLHTPVAMHSVSNSVVSCMICCEPCPQNRSPSGHSTPRSLCRHITTCLTLPLSFHPTSSSLAGNLSYQLTHVLGHTTTSVVGPTNWVQQHQLHLQDSHAGAPKHLQETVAERRKQTDQKVADHPLHVGDLVYLRNHVLGSSKIQD